MTKIKKKLFGRLLTTHQLLKRIRWHLQKFPHLEPIFVVLEEENRFDKTDKIAFLLRPGLSRFYKIV